MDYPQEGKLTLLFLLLLQTGLHSTIIDLEEQDSTYISLTMDGKILEESHHILVPKTLRGIEFNSEKTINLDKRYDSLTVLYARVILEEGDTIVVLDKAINEVTRYGVSEAFGFLSTTTISFTGLKPGVRIEYGTRIKSESVIKNNIDGIINFSTSKGVKSRKIIIVEVPENTKLLYESRNGLPEPEIIKEGRKCIYKWHMDTLPQFTREINTPPEALFAPSLFFSTMSDWNDIAEFIGDLEKVFSSYIPEEIPDTKEIEKIRKWTQDFFQVSRTIGLEDLSYRPRSPKEIWDSGVATPEELNLILLGIMRNLGMDAHPVLLNAGDRKYRIRNEMRSWTRWSYYRTVSEINRDIPEIRYFSYLLIKEKDNLYDIGEPLTKNDLPYWDYNCEGISIDDKNLYFIRTKEFEDNLYNVEAKLKLSQDGDVEGRYVIGAKGAPAFEIREALSKLTRTEREKVIQQWLPGESNLLSWNFKDSIGVMMELNLKIPGYAVVQSDFIILKIPSIYSGFTGSQSDLLRISRRGERKQDIILDYLEKRDEKIEIELPDEYMIMIPPEEMEYEGDNLSLHIKIEKDNNLFIKREFQTKSRMIKREESIFLLSKIRKFLAPNKGLLVLKKKGK